jgi:two-component system response regulator VicR
MTPRLLVLDDEPDLLYLYQLILEPEGYLVHIAPSGFEQVTDIEHFQPDLLILDYHLSQRRRGAEPLWRQLKAYPPTSALPMILCTADAYAISDEQDLLRAHHVGVILKPFAIAALVQLVRQMLQETAEPTQ